MCSSDLTQALGEASVTLGKDLVNYEDNTVLANDINALGNLNVDGNYGAYGELWASYQEQEIKLPTANVYHEIGDYNYGDFYRTDLVTDANAIIIQQSGMYLINASMSF